MQKISTQFQILMQIILLEKKMLSDFKFNQGKQKQQQT